MSGARFIDLEPALNAALAGVGDPQSLIVALNDSATAENHARAFAAALNGDDGVVVLVATDAWTNEEVTVVAHRLALALAPRVRVNAAINGAESGPKETATVIAFLCANRALTGQVLRVGATFSPG